MFFLERANGPEVHNAALPSSSKQITFCTRGLWAQNSWQDKLLAFNLTKLVWSLMQQIMSGPIFQEKWTRVSRVFTCQIQVTAVQGISCKWVTIWPIKLTKKTFTGWIICMFCNKPAIRGKKLWDHLDLYLIRNKILLKWRRKIQRMLS